jgi:hypothetical protein
LVYEKGDAYLRVPFSVLRRIVGLYPQFVDYKIFSYL